MQVQLVMSIYLFKLSWLCRDFISMCNKIRVKQFWDAGIDSTNHSVHKLSAPQPFAKLVYVFICCFEGTMFSNNFIK